MPEESAPNDKSNNLLKPLRIFFSKRGVKIPKKTPAQVLAQARKIVLGLERGESYLRYRGKRLIHPRQVISIPVGRKWRMIAVCREDQIVIERLLSHEAYNHFDPRSLV